MRRLFLLLLVTLLISAGSSMPVLAHTLKIDGQIGVTLHSNPNDDVQVGRSAGLVPTIQDSSGRFTGEQCVCEMRILRGEEVVTTLSYRSSTPTQYTFQSGGTHAIQVMGTPRAADSFQPFTVEFSVFVSGTGVVKNEPEADRTLKQWLPVVVLGGGALLLWILIEPLKRRENQA